MERPRKPWERYEEVARQLIEMMKADLNLASVDGKQNVSGRSGVSWEIDAVARRVSGDTVIVECRRTKGRLSQEDMAAVAYRVRDTGSAGGITVSPEPLQAGARIVAAAEGIEHIRLDADSTASDYVMELLGRRFIGLSIHEQLHAQDTIDCEVIRDGRSVPG